MTLEHVELRAEDTTMPTTADSFDNAPRRRAPRIVRALAAGRYYQDSDGCWYLSPIADGSHVRPSSSRGLRFAMLEALAKRYGRAVVLFDGFRRRVD